VILAEMTATDVAAIVVAIASVVGVVLLVLALVTISRTLTTLRLTIEQMRRETVPVLTELQRTVTTANTELEKLDDLLDSATSVSATVDSASHLAYLAFSNPIIKAMAVATGAAKASKALRRRD
jgi:uncharacterized membrane protein